MIVAELAVAIAGFAGVVFALRGRVEDLSPVAKVRLWRLVETSLATALFSLLPLAFHHLGLAASAVWGLSSALFATWLIGAALVLARHSRAVEPRDVPRVFNASFAVSLLLALAVLISNALGLGYHREFGPYFAALLAYLALSGLVFARLLLARN